jgi:3-dehydroquinate synthase
LPQQKACLKTPYFTDDLPLLFSSKKERGDCLSIVISKKVAGYYPGLILGLKKKSFPVILWNDGEKAKTGTSKEKLEAELLRSEIERSSTLAAVGGGTLLDLCGFTAATLFRGIKWIAVPTTLLAMVDASIGGKTGINNKFGKNLTGAFHFPEEIYVWQEFLETLPGKETQNGLAECLKHGLIGDEHHYLEVLNADPGDKNEMRKIIKNSQRIKMNIVRKDPFDQNGERNLLNFGHSVGHGLEKWSGYKLSHGRAVALGMAWELALATLEGYCERLAYNQIKEELFRLAKPDVLKNIDPEDLWRSMSFDKKRKGKTIYYVPLKQAGAPALSAPYLSPLKFELLKKSYKLLMER